MNSRTVAPVICPSTWTELLHSDSGPTTLGDSNGIGAILDVRSGVAKEACEVRDFFHLFRIANCCRSECEANHTWGTKFGSGFLDPAIALGTADDDAAPSPCPLEPITRNSSLKPPANGRVDISRNAALNRHCPECWLTLCHRGTSASCLERRAAMCYASAAKDIPAAADRADGRTKIVITSTSCKQNATMTYLAKPKFHHPGLAKNLLGYTHRDYEGKISTLCAGCGHDSITAAIIEACFELSIEPHRVAKISGIGCSSKTPDYFLGNSHGFNSVHGRMPSVLTGANLANRDLIYLGVSGDGDSASIGFGQFAHSIRRGVNMTYIVENNGVYGLTKGQFSATADRGSKSKKGVVNTDSAIDMVAMALQLGASLVARSFSGDKNQLVPIIKAAIEHQGAAFIDVISPCVAFNNHAGSTKSYDYVREHNEAVNRLDFMTGRDPIVVDYAPGAVQTVEQHDGTTLVLRKINADYDVHDRVAAMSFLQQHAAKGQVVTGVLYLDREAEDLHRHLNTTETPLNALSERELSPGSAVLDNINAGLRLSSIAGQRRPSDFEYRHVIQESSFAIIIGH